MEPKPIRLRYNSKDDSAEIGLTVCDQCEALHPLLKKACDQTDIHVMSGFGRDSVCHICDKERGGASVLMIVQTQNYLLAQLTVNTI